MRLAVLNGTLIRYQLERELYKIFYKHLAKKRYHISELAKERFPEAEIACRLKYHPSTITRT